MLNTHSSIPKLLQETGSMTKQLKSRAKQSFSVEVIDEYWREPTEYESEMLEIAFGQRCFIREVCLWVDDVRIIFGLTVIPESTVAGSGHALCSLGETPLGEWLFAQSSLKCGEFVFRQIQSSDYLYSLIQKRSAEPVAANSLWCRHRVFSVAAGSLLVNECLLNEL